MTPASHRNSWTGWLALALLFSASAYAIAEDITLTTYYPSPRGVYQELRTQGDVGVGDVANPPGARLHVTRTDDLAPAVRVDDQAADATPFVIDANGNVGIGTAAPAQPLDVVGNIRTSGDYVRGPDIGATGDVVAGTRCDVGFNIVERRFQFRGGIYVGFLDVVIGSCAPPPPPPPIPSGFPIPSGTPGSSP